MALKKWLVTLSVAALVGGLFAAPAWAQDEDFGDEPTPKKKVKKAKTPKAGGAEKQARGGKGVGAGTPLAGALAKMELSDEQKTQVGEALSAWKEKADAERKANAEKRKELMAQMKGADKDKKAELQAEMKKLAGSSGKDQYASAKQAVSGILSAEQNTQLDSLTKSAQSEAALKQFDGMIAGFGKKNVELTDEQQTKVAEARTKLEKDLAGLEAGQANEARSAAMKAVWQVRKDVLTDDQRTALGQKAPQGGEKKQREPKQPREQKKKQPRNDEGGDENGGFEGEM